jgi:hypothetical protein
MEYFDMNNEELFLKEKFSPDKKLFTVPDGYFDSLADRIIEGLPEEKAAVKHSASKWWMYAAASVIIAVASVTTYLRFNAQQDNVAPKQMAAAASTDSFDEAADYAMLDNQDIYACLTYDY